MSAYSKALTAVVGAVVMAVASAMTDDTISHPEWVMIAVAGFTAFQVFVTANVGLPLWNYSKSITAGALAGLGLLGGYLANGEHMSNALWLNVAIAAAVAAGVFAVPNGPVRRA
jgi:hypothetical protein